jgi:hypothetical protein
MLRAVAFLSLFLFLAYAASGARAQCGYNQVS